MAPLVAITLTPEERGKLAAYLATLATAPDPRAARYAAQCREAVNVRAVALGLAKEPEAIAFTPDEAEWLRARIAATRDFFAALAVTVGAPDAKTTGPVLPSVLPGDPPQPDTAP